MPTLCTGACITLACRTNPPHSRRHAAFLTGFSAAIVLVVALVPTTAAIPTFSPSYGVACTGPGAGVNILAPGGTYSESGLAASVTAGTLAFSSQTAGPVSGAGNGQLTSQESFTVELLSSYQLLPYGDRDVQLHLLGPDERIDHVRDGDVGGRIAEALRQRLRLRLGRPLRDSPVDHPGEYECQLSSRPHELRFIGERSHDHDGVLCGHERHPVRFLRRGRRPQRHQHDWRRDGQFGRQRLPGHADVGQLSSLPVGEGG